MCMTSYLKHFRTFYCELGSELVLGLEVEVTLSLSSEVTDSVRVQKTDLPQVP